MTRVRVFFTKIKETILVFMATSTGVCFLFGCNSHPFKSVRTCRYNQQPGHVFSFFRSVFSFTVLLFLFFVVVFFTLSRGVWKGVLLGVISFFRFFFTVAC